MMKLQERISLLNSYDEMSEQHHDLYEGIMKDIVKSKELYTIVRKESSSKSIEDGTAPIFCGLGYNNIPAVWLFTEESIAKAYANHYQMVKDGVLLYKKVSVEELTVFLFNGMFSGISELIIDEGKNTLITNVYDFVNTGLASMQKQPVLEKQEYRMMNIFNQMKFAGKKMWLVPQEETTGEELMFNTFSPEHSDNTIKIYEDQHRCEKDSLIYGYKDGFAAPVGIDSLFKVLHHSISNGVEEIVFVGNDFEVKMSFRKVLSILDRMRS